MAKLEHNSSYTRQAVYPVGLSLSRVTVPGEGEMESRDFCYWLQGYFELRHGSEPLDIGQITLIKRHLDLVFRHTTDASLREKPVEPHPIRLPEPAPLPTPEPKESPAPPLLPPYPQPPAPMC